MSQTKFMVPDVEVACVTDPGRDPEKQVNEDTCRHAETPFGHLTVVCDGMGGHLGGREASTLAVASVFRYFAAAPTRRDIPPVVRVREVLRDAILVANHEVFSLAPTQAAARPGSTIVAVLVHPLGTEVAHVGDSRCYFVHDGQVRQLTKDHSMVQGLVDAGRLSPAGAAVHPDANMITRALGMSADVEVELQRSSIVHVAGDTFVLCSDGLSDLVSADEIRDAVSSLAPAQAASRLVEQANLRGGHDNVTVAVVRPLQNALASLHETTEPIALQMTAPMQAVPTPSNRPLAAPEPRSPTPATPDSSPLLPPAPPPSTRARRRRWPPALSVALLVGLGGIVVLGVVLALLLAPRPHADDAHAPSLSIVLPGASLEPGTPAPPTPDLDTTMPDAAPRSHRPRNKTRR